jgi:3-deoxy-D-manno-octulosonic acid kinase
VGDRLRQRSHPLPGNWQQANLERLLRSFNKESQLHTSFHFVPENWQALMAGYQGKVA